MLIYTTHITPRLEYTCQLVFDRHLGCGYALTTDAAVFARHTGPALNYSNTAFSNGAPQLLPATLLHEQEITRAAITFIHYRGINCPFAVGTGVLPFDVLAATFYMVSRYEEYLPHVPNRYGQFPAAESMAVQQGFLAQPVVDIWIQRLGEKLLALYPQLPLKQHRFRALFTYDIDTAYAYRGRSVWRRMVAILKDRLQGNTHRLQERKAVLAGQQPDPYDTYEHIEQIQRQYGHELRFFFLLGNRNQYNRNLHHNNAVLRQLITQLSAAHPYGIHPSYYADAQPGLLEKELQRLQAITGRAVTHSRQHYLRLQWPQTYRQLAAAGITNDYTLGFAETPGFRAGTCRPYYFFDLKDNRATTLLLHPFTLMEGSFAEDMALSPESALPQMLQLLEAVRAVQGEFICIWHNHSLSNTGFWQGWRAVHDQLAKHAAEQP